jgi:hypothetical protein
VTTATARAVEWLFAAKGVVFQAKRDLLGDPPEAAHVLEGAKVAAPGRSVSWATVPIWWRILAVAFVAGMAAATIYEALYAPRWALLVTPFAAAGAAATGDWLFRRQMRRGPLRPSARLWAAAGAFSVMLAAAPDRAGVIVMASLTALCVTLLAYAMRVRAWPHGTGSPRLRRTFPNAGTRDRTRF